jgi:hypothetical protein
MINAVCYREAHGPQPVGFFLPFLDTSLAARYPNTMFRCNQ